MKNNKIRNPLFEWTAYYESGDELILEHKDLESIINYIDFVEMSYTFYTPYGLSYYNEIHNYKYDFYYIRINNMDYKYYPNIDELHKRVRPDWENITHIYKEFKREEIINNLI